MNMKHRDAYGQALLELTGAGAEIIAVDGDIGSATGGSPVRLQSIPAAASTWGWPNRI
ncbi:hypothetical protein MASR2M79_00200 [Aminivibrio sp.]